MRGREVDLRADITIRPFADDDAPQVRELFIVVNRLLSPPDLRDAFEAYIERALAEEIDRITAYYEQRDGSFWVAMQNDKLVGTFGLERPSPDMELRRMHVDPGARRRGIARQMLRFTEDECRRRKISKLELVHQNYKMPRSRSTTTQGIVWFARTWFRQEAIRQ